MSAAVYPVPNIPSAGILLAAAPGIGYLLTWIYLLGYANQFNIPSDLIAPQLGNVLATTFLFALAMLLILGLMVLFQARILRWSRGSIGPIEARIAVLAFFSFFSLVLAVTNWPPVQEWVVMGALLLILAIYLFLPAVRTRGGTFRDRLKRADEERAARESPPSWTTLFWPALFVAVFFVGVLAYDAGSLKAHGQRDYLVTDGSTPQVVLAIYGDNVILAPFDRSKKTMKAEFDIVKISTSPMHLRLLPVGPLTLQS